MYENLSSLQKKQLSDAKFELIVLPKLPKIPHNLKSINLQYNTLVHWTDGTNNSSTKHLMFKILSFSYRFLQNSLQKPFQSFFYRITKMKIKNFECPKYIRSYEKIYTWSIICLVDELFVPSAQRTTVLYCRLSDLRTCFSIECTKVQFKA